MSSAMQPTLDVTHLSDVPPRISALGHSAVTEIAARTGVPKEIVMRAMLLTSLENQRCLMKHIERLRGHEDELDSAF